MGKNKKSHIHKNKKHQLSLQHRTEKQRKKRKQWEKSKNRKNNFPPNKELKEVKKNITKAKKQNAPAQVKAPEKFSLIHEPEEVLHFFATIHKYLMKRVEVMVDFSEIKEVTPDALALLLAKISSPQFCNNTKIYGNKPTKPELDDVFRQSGFYYLLKIEHVKPEQGIIHTMKNTIVDRDVAVEARKLTAKKTFNNNEHIKPLFRTLIECMANTTKHAKGKSVRNETWWLVVLNNSATKVTSFSFIDTGVGIFKSAKIKKLTKFAIKLGFRSNIDILKDLLEGKIISSTGLPYRGKGLPKIYKDFKNKELANLHIISNNIYANLATGTFIELNSPLNGTFFYWEILPHT